MSRRSQPPSFARASLALLTALLLLAGTLLAQDQTEPFRGEARVAAVDLVFAFADVTDPRDLPRRIQPRDFEIRYRGEARTVLGLEPGSESGAVTEPWTTVVWLDATLGARADLRWALAVLGERADELVALGTVEIVVADPYPRILLEPTRDAALVLATVARLALEPLDAEEAVVALRDEVLEAAAEHPEAEARALLARAAIAEEKRLVRRHQDQLGGWLVDRPATGGRRALFLAGAGYDLRPADFYATHLGVDATAAATADGALATGELDAAAVTLTRILAAYGWIVFPVVPPPPELLVEGASLGKLHIPADQRRQPREDEVTIPDIDPVTMEPVDRDRVFVPMAGATIRNRRNPKKAAAYVELARTHHRYGKLEEAAETYQKALAHYDGDPKTRAAQAAVWAELADVFEQLGRRASAREAQARAVSLEPERAQAADRGGLLARLLAPREPLQRLAATTTGVLIESPEALAAALGALDLRLRLTYSVSGMPAGTLDPVEVRFRREKWTLVAPRWARSATPTAVAALRLRRLLDGALDDGELEVEAKFVPVPEDPRRGRITARLGFAPDGDGEPAAARWLRASIAYGVPAALLDPEEAALAPPPVLRHETPIAVRTDAPEWRYQADVALPPGPTWIVVLIEDLDAGSWGAGMVELERE